MTYEVLTGRAGNTVRVVDLIDALEETGLPAAPAPAGGHRHPALGPQGMYLAEKEKPVRAVETWTNWSPPAASTSVRMSLRT